MRSWTRLVSACLVGGGLSLFPAIAGAQGTSVTQAIDVEKTAAQKAYVDALAHYKAGRLEKALEGFRLSYNTVASPNSHLMVANALFDMGRYDEAYVEAESTAEEGEALGANYAASATAARELQKKIQPLVGFVTVSVPAGAKGPLRIDDREIPPARWSKPIAVLRGAHEVVLTTEQGPQKTPISLAAGESTTVDFAAAPPPPSKDAEVSASSDDLFGFLETEPTMRLAGYGAAGVGVLGLVGFAVLGSLNNAKFSDIEDKCAGGTCPAGTADDVSTGKSLQTGANVMAVVGIVGVAAGATLITLSYTMESPQADAPSPAPASPQVSLAVGPASVEVRGSF